MMKKDSNTALVTPKDRPYERSLSLVWTQVPRATGPTPPRRAAPDPCHIPPIR